MYVTKSARDSQQGDKTGGKCRARILSCGPHERMNMIVQGFRVLSVACELYFVLKMHLILITINTQLSFGHHVPVCPMFERHHMRWPNPF